MSRQASLPAFAGWGTSPSPVLALQSAVAWAVLGSALLPACASAGGEGSLPPDERGRSAAACSPPAAFQGFLRTHDSAAHPDVGLILGTKSWPWTTSVRTLRRLKVKQGVWTPSDLLSSLNPS